MATADFFEYEDGGGYEMPGEVLILQLCQFWKCFPEDLIGKDIPRLVRLMDLNRVQEVALAARRDKGKMSPGEISLHQIIEKMRDQDERFHGPLEPEVPEAPKAED